jgi:hypothetical protein
MPSQHWQETRSTMVEDERSLPCGNALRLAHMRPANHLQFPHYLSPDKKLNNPQTFPWPTRFLPSHATRRRGIYIIGRKYLRTLRINEERGENSTGRNGRGLEGARSIAMVSGREEPRISSPKQEAAPEPKLPSSTLRFVAFFNVYVCVSLTIGSCILTAWISP